ncbi:MAG: ABC transporter ATP-binding protein [Planctomycetes bacterium]|nr:ABC transporter ATP-binding protein [Planctomycetota bacterium]
MIEVVDLIKEYEGTPAVQGLSFTVQPGEVLGLVGPNGAGKTTTMRCITGILQPTGGGVRVAGADIVRDPVEAKRHLAFIPDDPQLFDYLTIREHLLFFGRVFNVPDVADQSARLLEELELTGKEDMLPGQISRGMKQKVAIACGLIHRPKAVLFDEPLTGLDPVAIRRIKQTIRQLAADGSAVIISSHLLGLVEEIATSLLLLQNGKKVLHGTIAEVRASIPDLQGGNLESIFLRATGYDQPEASS